MLGPQFKQDRLTPGMGGPAQDTTDYYHFSGRSRRGPDGSLTMPGVHAPDNRWGDADTWDGDSPRNTHAGTEQAALERGAMAGSGTHLPTSGTMHVLRPKKGKMVNTPNSAISDTLANEAYTPVGGNTPPANLAQNNPYDRAFPKDELIDAELDEGKGAYYVNDVEDRGSTSLVAPSESLERRMSFDVTGPTVESETPNFAQYDYPSRVAMGTKPDRYGFAQVQWTDSARQDRLFQTDGVRNAKSIGKPRYDRYA